jgi:hypothetical protein
MKLSGIGMQPWLRVASALIIVGLGIEVVTLLWFHPLAFGLFAFVAAPLIALGILLFLVPLVFVATTSATDGGIGRSGLQR